jgi:hypothetical protein
MADFQLNPVTRKRLVYILAFLLIDAVVALYVAFADPNGAASLPAFGFGFVMLAASGTVASILIVEKYKITGPQLGSSTTRKRT